MNEKFEVTPEGFRALRDLLQHLEVDERARIGELIGDAVEDSKDLNENYAFRDAKLAQGALEVQIADLKRQLKNVVIVEPSAEQPEHVSLGCTVRIELLERKEVREYAVVGSQELMFYQGAISTESPVGKALVGHGVGDRVEVKTPGGNTYHYLVLEIRPLNRGIQRL